MASAVVLFLLPASGRAYAQSAGASPVTVQWDNGLTVAADEGAAYIDVRLSPTFRVRIGKDKTPLGLEQLYADLASNLVPNRDVGVQAQGEVAGALFRAQFNLQPSL